VGIGAVYSARERFGQAGFQGVVDKVADIEKSLGIYDLSQFTRLSSPLNFVNSVARYWD
jgi:hypothetical protein